MDMHTPKNQEKASYYLGIIIKTLTITSSVSLTLGSITTFFYLHSIQHPNLFTEAISNPSAFASILIAFGLLFYFIFISLIFPYTPILTETLDAENIKNIFPIIELNHENGLFKLLKKINVIFLIFLALHIVYLFLILIASFFPTKEESMPHATSILAITIALFSAIAYLFLTKEESIPCATLILTITIALFSAIAAFLLTKEDLTLYAIILVTTIPSIVLFCKINKLKPKEKIYSFCFSMGFFIFSFLICFTPIYILLHLFQWIPSKQFLFFIIYETFFLLNLYLAHNAFYSENYKNSNIKILITPLVLSLALLSSLTVFTDNLRFRLLHPIRFVESRDNAAWYLLNRNNSAISDEDLKTLKSRFIPPSIEQKDDKKIEKSEWLRNAEGRNNALFGYMAWNLGDKKIFCPVSVNNIEASQTKDMFSKCLSIEGKALQKMHEGYISSHSMTP